MFSFAKNHFEKKFEKVLKFFQKPNILAEMLTKIRKMLENFQHFPTFFQHLWKSFDFLKFFQNVSNFFPKWFLVKKNTFFDGIFFWKFISWSRRIVLKQFQNDSASLSARKLKDKKCFTEITGSVVVSAVTLDLTMICMRRITSLALIPSGVFADTTHCVFVCVACLVWEKRGEQDGGGDVVFWDVFRGCPR